MAIIWEDVLNSCRLCQNKSGEYNFSLDKKLKLKIFQCTKINVSDKLDLLPNMICFDCQRHINEIFSYMKKVKEVDKHLRNELTLNNISQDDQLRANTKQEIPNRCPVCSKTFRREKSFIAHKKAHIQLFCKNCQQDLDLSDVEHTCNGKQNTNLNIQNQEPVISGNFEETELPKLDDQITVEPTFTCTKENCGKVCTTAYSLKMHILKHDGIHHFLCVTCGKGFTAKNSLRCHEKIHLEVKEYICKICNIAFSIRSNLRAHEKKYHEGVRFYCSQCTKVFLTKSSLDRHEKTHTGIKEFACASCPAAFYTNKELMKHQKYHQGIKQYKCVECFKSFFERHHLLTHSRSHTGEKPYSCNISGCEKSFAEKQKLKRHHKAKHS